jgi:hypothetical protein
MVKAGCMMVTTGKSLNPSTLSKKTIHDLA